MAGKNYFEFIKDLIKQFFEVKIQTIEYIENKNFSTCVFQVRGQSLSRFGLL